MNIIIELKNSNKDKDRIILVIKNNNLYEYTTSNDCVGYNMIYIYMYNAKVT